MPWSISRVDSSPERQTRASPLSDAWDIPGKEEYHGVSNNFPDGRRQSVHSKFMAVNALYEGKPRRLLYTGSHNWNTTSLTQNDEHWVEVGSMHDVFTQHFLDVLWKEAELEPPRAGPHGGFCTSDSHCAAGLCVENSCRGTAPGAPCGFPTGCASAEACAVPDSTGRPFDNYCRSGRCGQARTCD
jgi:hypothetical protein